LVLGGVKRLLDRDLKKIVAFSTLRQLALIFIVGSLGLRVLMFFHLLCHASFKFILFLGVGRVIYLKSGGQDFRIFLGGHLFTFLVRSISVRGLLGIFFMSGFISKEIIFLRFFFSIERFFLFFGLMCSMTLTVGYSFILIDGLLSRGPIRRELKIFSLEGYRLLVGELILFFIGALKFFLFFMTLAFRKGFIYFLGG